MSGIKKFDGTEFEVWSTLMDAVLTARNLRQILDEEPPTADKQAELKVFNEKDRTARALILLALDAEIVKLVLTCTTAKQIWTRLRDVHSQKSDACMWVLMDQFFLLKMEAGQKVSEYVSKVEFTAQRLRDSGGKLDDTYLMGKIISGLTCEFRNFKSAWINVPNVDRTTSNLLQRLLAEESMNTAEAGNKVVAMKMQVNSSDKKNNKGSSKTKKSKKDIKCFHCDKLGHIKRDCHQLKRELAEQGGQASQVSSKEDGQRNFCTLAKSCGASSQSWFVDSGASFHMTANFDWLSGYRTFDHPIAITVGNNETLYAVGEGTVTVDARVGKKMNRVIFHQVRYVPGVTDNLFSQGAADSKGIKITTSNGRMDIINGEEIMMVGHKKRGNMYYLDVQVQPPARACLARESRTEEEWHRVLGHPGVGAIQSLAKQATVGFKICETAKTHDGCGGCCQGKAHHVSHPDSRRERATEVLERVHIDLVGPVRPTTFGGSRYFMLCRDEFSTYMHVYMMPSKDYVKTHLKEYINRAGAQSHRRVRITRSDNGSEFRNVDVKHLFNAEGIVQEFSAPYTPQQNGEIERANRTIIESARAMLSSSGLPLELWGEAVLTAVHLRNRLPNTHTGDKTPFELFHGKSPDYSYLLEFGLELHALNNSQSLSKFQPKTMEVFMVGYGDRTNTYRCFDPVKKTVIITADVYSARHTRRAELVRESRDETVTFTIEHSRDDERALPAGDGGGSVEPPANGQRGPGSSEEERCRRQPLSSVARNQTGCVPERAREAPASLPLPPAPTQSDSRANETFTVRAGGANTPPVVEQQVVHPHVPPQAFDGYNQFMTSTPQAAASGNRMITIASQLRPTVISSTPSVGPRSIGNSGQVEQDNSRAMAMTTADSEPKSYEEAVNGKDGAYWKAAIMEELEAHATNGTWEVVAKQPGTREISAKWVFKIKDDDGPTGRRFKGRLVARGFSQQPETDYNEIFAPVVRMDSVRLLFSLCSQFGLKYRQFDIASAFLNSAIDSELFLKPPEGLDIKEGFTCKLRKSLYGLKQAPRCWNNMFKDLLKTVDMYPTYSDPCVYVSKGERPVYLALYVDDGLVFAKDESDISKVLDHLKQKLKVKIIDSSCFLGVQIEKSNDGSIFLHQSRYVARVLARYKFEEGKGKPNPIEPGHALTDQSTLKQPVVAGFPYAEAIGSLQHCARATRPDISYPLSVLSKYMSCPRQAHVNGLKRVLRYMVSTPTHGLLYTRVNNPRLACYTDADWAGDKEDRKSISGLFTSIAGGPVTYRSRQQKSVAGSTTEAEYVAASFGARDVVWLDRFIRELNYHFVSKPILYIDNQSALKLIKNPEFHDRSKHIDIPYHIVRERYQEGLFDLEYVPSKQQLADIFTKAFTVQAFKELRQGINCVSIEEDNS